MGRARKSTPQISNGKNRSKSDADQFPSDDEDEIDTFYKERDDNLRTALSKTTKKKSVSWADDDDDENGQDEVLAFDDDDDSMNTDDDDDENEYQQIEEEEEGEEDEDLSGAWGTSRKTFYNEDANVDDEDAKLEEQEAVQIQKKYYEMLAKNDFGLDLFQQKPSTLAPDHILDEQSLRRHIILPDNLLELSSDERLQLIRDQSPELEPLCHEFKRIFDDLKIYLLPLIQLVLDTSALEEFQSYSGWQFVLAVLELYLTYCSYLSLYLMMKSKDLSLSKHPIINDIEQYRQLCQIVNDDFQSMKNDLLKLCEVLQERKTQLNQKTKDISTKPQLILNPKIVTPTISSNGTQKKVSLRERMVKRREEQDKNDVSNDEVEDQPTQKRGITYEMQKNKGLTVKRKKENRNPRVRHRNKYARALVKRKSRVPTARTEEERYVGEPTGIRAGIKRGIKLKS